MSVRSPFMPSDSPRSPAAERRRQIQRRRATALAAIGLLVLIVSIIVDGGSTSTHRTPPSPRAAERQRLHTAVNLARRRLAIEDRAIDRVLAYTPFVTSGGGRKREVALTFDDGPGPYTTQVLKTLHDLQVPATFFEVGFMERWFHGSTTQAIADGNVVGDHTESHPKLGSLSRPDQRNQIVSQAEWLHKLGAPRPRLFRPPFGSFDARTFRVLRHNSMLMVLWSVDTNDYRQPGVKVIVRRALQGAKPGAIILLHDGGGVRSQTIAALPEIVKKLRQRHLKPVTVPQLMLDDPPPRGQPLPHYLSGG
jgi:peptidoglycan/xylan/chitin deacetylase (PgdA/CDA1 family)